ncbi:MAG: MBL fold metallo-hydrolase [Patescibacteria group bacterium]
MKITKLGHCCLVVEEGSLKILTDPGDYTMAQNQVTGIDVILITHEHPDHLHTESLKTVLINNPSALVFTNKGVGRILGQEQITYQLLEHKQNQTVKGVVIKGWGEKHTPIYHIVPQVINTSYFIADRLFYPGDTFYQPPKPVEVLALPVAGPWMKIAETLDYAKVIKPKVCFPIHDGMLKHWGSAHKLPPKVLSPLGVKFFDLESVAQFEV